MSISLCCLKGFEWEGTPVGQVGKLANLDSYITGSNPNVAILLIHDLLSWEFPNIRLLADHYAREVNATVYVSDFLGGEKMPMELIANEEWSKIDLPGISARNSREIREPEIFACAKELRAKFKKVGAVGFCFGGWACFRLGAKEHQPPLVDCISVGHPSWVIKKDIDDIAVPVQILAPEIDPVFTAELKSHAFNTIINLGIPFDYQHFPGVVHACLTRGDKNKPGEREAMVRGKNSAVSWLKQFLYESVDE
jgi:dienelactone hydrolase